MNDFFSMIAFEMDTELKKKYKNKEFYFPVEVFKSILQYCGKPLPADEYNIKWLDMCWTRRYTRSRGEIINTLHEPNIKCDRCSYKEARSKIVKGLCSHCYENPCVVCGEEVAPAYERCFKCRNKAFGKGKCFIKL